MFSWTHSNSPGVRLQRFNEPEEKRASPSVAAVKLRKGYRQRLALELRAGGVRGLAFIRVQLANDLFDDVANAFVFPKSEHRPTTSVKVGVGLQITQRIKSYLIHPVR